MILTFNEIILITAVWLLIGTLFTMGDYSIRDKGEGIMLGNAILKFLISPFALILIGLIRIYKYKILVKK
jgi:hypothetical protein